LFLDTHKRFYLVVCELHCDVAGLPNANPDEVCETGFVVRRRGCDVPQPVRRETAARLRRIATRRARLAQVDRIAPATRVAVLRRPVCDDAVARRRVDLTRALVDERAQLAALPRGAGALDGGAGWLPAARAPASAAAARASSSGARRRRSTSSRRTSASTGRATGRSRSSSPTSRR